jgi:hypothetical protein
MCMYTCGRVCSYEYVYTRVRVFVLMHGFTYEVIALMSPYTCGFDRAHVYIHGGCDCAYIHARVGVIALMSAHTSELDHAHV